MIHGNKNRDIEALRAIGIIFVMIAHAYKLTPWQTPLDGSLHAIYYYFGWWTGVDLFFCVSGFIITSNIINNIKDNNSKVSLDLLHLQFLLG
jgi:peptidoglycan/LPS O-acetylase OafA/YrhL